MQKYFLEVKTFRFSLIIEKDFLLVKWRIKNIETNILFNSYFRWDFESMLQSLKNDSVLLKFKPSCNSLYFPYAVELSRKKYFGNCIVPHLVAFTQIVVWICQEKYMRSNQLKIASSKLPTAFNTPNIENLIGPASSLLVTMFLLDEDFRRFLKKI